MFLCHAKLPVYRICIEAASKKFCLVCDNQGRSQPHSSGWARVPLSSFFPQVLIDFSLIFPQTLLIFFLILALRVGDSPTQRGPGYATGDNSVNGQSDPCNNLRGNATQNQN